MLYSFLFNNNIPKFVRCSLNLEYLLHYLRSTQWNADENIIKMTGIYIYIYNLGKLCFEIFFGQISTPMSCQVLNWNMEISNGLNLEGECLKKARNKMVFAKQNKEKHLARNWAWKTILTKLQAEVTENPNNDV